MDSALQSPRFYITTAIDYPNAAPHIGTALEKVGADVMARFRRMQGMDTLFSMGLDENSQHVLRAAEEANVSARDLGGPDGRGVPAGLGILGHLL